MAKSLQVESILIQGDSQLIIGQVNGACKVKQCIKGFTKVKFQQILREENTKVDSLAKEAFADELVDNQIKVQYIPDIDILDMHHIDGEASWTTLIVSYLKDGFLPQDKEEARKLRVRAAKFVLMDEV